MEANMGVTRDTYKLSKYNRGRFMIQAQSLKKYSNSKPSLDQYITIRLGTEELARCSATDKPYIKGTSKYGNYVRDLGHRLRNEFTSTYDNPSTMYQDNAESVKTKLQTVLDKYNLHLGDIKIPAVIVFIMGFNKLSKQVSKEICGYEPSGTIVGNYHDTLKLN